MRTLYLSEGGISMGQEGQVAEFVAALRASGFATTDSPGRKFSISKLLSECRTGEASR